MILLDGKDSLEDVDKKTYRIYWEWLSQETSMESIEDNYKVKANIEIEQLINQT